MYTILTEWQGGTVYHEGRGIDSWTGQGLSCPFHTCSLENVLRITSRLPPDLCIHTCTEGRDICSYWYNMQLLQQSSWQWVHINNMCIQTFVQHIPKVELWRVGHSCGHMI